VKFLIPSEIHTSTSKILVMRALDWNMSN